MSFVATTSSQVPTRAVRSVAASRPTVSMRTVRPSRRVMKLFAEPTKTPLEKAIEEAEEACKDGGKTDECASAWDVVEEMSAEVSHKKDAAKVSKKDPLEEYCEEAPDADECRVYED